MRKSIRNARNVRLIRNRPVPLRQDKGEGGSIVYLLDDQFLDNLPAGSVNGTAATPGPGTRTVVDTNSKLSVGSDVLSFATGGAAADEPRLFYGAVTRAAGTLGLFQLGAISAEGARFALSKVNTGAQESGAFVAGANIISQLTTAATTVQVGAWAAATNYNFVVVLRASGEYLFVKGGIYTNWTLLYFDALDNTASLIPLISADDTTSVFTSDFIRIPDPAAGHTFLPEPLAYDTFTRANGALGSTETTGPDGQSCTARVWSTTTGVINTNQLQVVPTLGAELLTNGNFTAWTGDDPDGWSVSAETGGSEISEVGSGEGHGGTGTGSCNWYKAPGGGNVTMEQNNVFTVVNGWYRIVLNKSYNAASALYVAPSGPGGFGLYTGASTTEVTFKNPGSQGLRAYVYADNADNTSDYFSVKQITLSSCLAGINEGSNQNVLASVGLTITAFTQAGLMLRLDNIGTPANYLHVYCNRIDAKIYVDEVAAGVVTNKSSTAFTYSAGTDLVVRLIDTSYYVWYNNTYITNGTTTAAGNTATAVFMTDSASRADNFTVFPSTTSGEGDDQYADFNKYVP